MTKTMTKTHTKTKTKTKTRPDHMSERTHVPCPSDVLIVFFFICAHYIIHMVPVRNRYKQLDSAYILVCPFECTNNLSLKDLQTTNTIFGDRRINIKTYWRRHKFEFNNFHAARSWYLAHMNKHIILANSIWSTSKSSSLWSLFRLWETKIAKLSHLKTYWWGAI